MTCDFAVSALPQGNDAADVCVDVRVSLTLVQPHDTGQGTPETLDRGPPAFGFKR